MGWKALREKEKLLVTSNFSFPHNVFQSYISLVRQNAALCGTGLNKFLSSPLPVNYSNSPVLVQNEGANKLSNS